MVVRVFLFPFVFLIYVFFLLSILINKKQDQRSASPIIHELEEELLDEAANNDEEM